MQTPAARIKAAITMTGVGIAGAAVAIVLTHGGAAPQTVNVRSAAQTAPVVTAAPTTLAPVVETTTTVAPVPPTIATVPTTPVAPPTTAQVAPAAVAPVTAAPATTAFPVSAAKPVGPDASTCGPNVMNCQDAAGWHNLSLCTFTGHSPDGNPLRSPQYAGQKPTNAPCVDSQGAQHLS